MAALALASLGCGARTGLRAPDALLDASTDALPLFDAPPLPCDAPLPDGGCPPCLRAGVSPWQIDRTRAPFCFGRTFAMHGDRAMYDLITIPPADAASWSPAPRLAIDFADPSSLCDRACRCLDGGEFTFFQTFVRVPDARAVRRFVVRVAMVDDGARVTVFNARFPAGVTDADAFVFFPAGGTADLTRYLVTGTNRLVITHVDDCCQQRRLVGVQLELDDIPLGECR